MIEERVRGCTSGRGLSGVDVADDDHVDVHLVFTGVRSMVSGSSERCGVQ